MPYRSNFGIGFGMREASRKARILCPWFPFPKDVCMRYFVVDYDAVVVVVVVGDVVADVAVDDDGRPILHRSGCCRYCCDHVDRKIPTPDPVRS